MFSSTVIWILAPWYLSTIRFFIERPTDKTITKAYRKLAKEWHPDRFTDPTEKEAAQKKIYGYCRGNGSFNRRRKAETVR